MSYTNYKYYYVSTNGNDVNAGTKSSPFRTLDKALSMSNEYADVRIQIISNGTYTITRNCLSSMSLHLLVDDTTLKDVKVNFKVSHNVQFYNVYFHFRNFELIIPKDYSVYFDQSGACFENVRVTGSVLDFNFSNLIAKDCSFYQLHADYSYIFLSNTTITNTDKSSNAMRFNYCSDIYVIDGISAKDLTTTKAVISCNTCGNVRVESVISKKVNYQYFVWCNNCSNVVVTEAARKSGNVKIKTTA